MFSILHACTFITMLVLLHDETFQTVCIPLFKYENRNEAVTIHVEDTLQRTFLIPKDHIEQMIWRYLHIHILEYITEITCK